MYTFASSPSNLQLTLRWRQLLQGQMPEHLILCCRHREQLFPVSVAGLVCRGITHALTTLFFSVTLPILSARLPVITCKKGGESCPWRTTYDSHTQCPPRTPHFMRLVIIWLKLAYLQPPVDYQLSWSNHVCLVKTLITCGEPRTPIRKESCHSSRSGSMNEWSISLLSRGVSAYALYYHLKSRGDILFSDLSVMKGPWPTQEDKWMYGYGDLPIIVESIVTPILSGNFNFYLSLFCLRRI